MLLKKIFFLAISSVVITCVAVAGTMIFKNEPKKWSKGITNPTTHHDYESLNLDKGDIL